MSDAPRPRRRRAVARWLGAAALAPLVLSACGTSGATDTATAGTTPPGTDATEGSALDGIEINGLRVGGAIGSLAEEATTTTSTTAPTETLPPTTFAPVTTRPPTTVPPETLPPTTAATVAPVTLPSKPPPAYLSGNLTTEEQAVLNKIREIRGSNGLAPLSPEVNLTNAARQQSQRNAMSANNATVGNLFTVITADFSSLSNTAAKGPSLEFLTDFLSTSGPGSPVELLTQPWAWVGIGASPSPVDSQIYAVIIVGR